MVYQFLEAVITSYSIHYTKLYDETTKDIVQEGFLKVFSNIKQFKGKGSFEGWMKRIFINTAITYIPPYTVIRMGFFAFIARCSRSTGIGGDGRYRRKLEVFPEPERNNFV